MVIWETIILATEAVGVRPRPVLQYQMNEVKQMYLNAEMDVVKFSIEDVIATSNDSSTTSSSNKGGLGGENEGPAGDSFL